MIYKDCFDSTPNIALRHHGVHTSSYGIIAS